MYLCTQVEITEMKKERETTNKYRQQALEGDLMAMNNMGVCYAQGIGVVEDHVMAFLWYMKAAQRGHKLLHNRKNSPKRSEFLRFYLYFCHVIQNFVCFYFATLR